ncbi:MAG: hypothetical protein J6C92_00650 [Bacteroidaceae bacterium]|nr:hypothetical protein [Bacteroidaceae bacterium]
MAYPMPSFFPIGSADLIVEVAQFMGKIIYELRKSKQNSNKNEESENADQYVKSCILVSFLGHRYLLLL